jgi:hypothetical protein
MATWDVIQLHGGSIPLILAKPSRLRLLRSLCMILFSILACVVNLPTRAAAESAPAKIARPDDARSGSLLLKTEGGGYVAPVGSASTSTSPSPARPSGRG